MELLEKDIKNNILKLSVSKCKSFTDCPAKYRYTYELKLPRKEFEFFAFGKFIHKVLEDFHREYINGSKELFNKVMGKAYKDAIYEFKLSSDAKKEAYAIIDSYLQRISAEKEAMKSITAVEKNFAINISDAVVLNGMIDRVQLDPDGIVHLCDYKTIKNKKYIKNDFLQLLTYAYAIYIENPEIERVRGSYILLRHNFEYITKEFSKQEILSVKSKYEEYARMIEEEKLWAPKPSPLCKWCDFLNVCDKGKEYLNKDKKSGKIGW